MLGSKYKKIMLALGDIAIFYLGLEITLFIKYGFAERWDLHFYPFLWAHILWLLIFYSAGMYDWEKFPPTRRYYVAQLAASSMVASGITAVFLFYLIPIFRITPKTNLFLDILIVSILLVIWRIWFVKIASKGNGINVLFFGSNNETNKFAQMLQKNNTLGYKVAGIWESSRLDHQSAKDFIVKNKINLIVVEPDILQNEELVRIFYEALPYGVSIEKFSELYESVMGKVPTSLINKSWFLENLAEINKRPFEISKRIIDTATAIILSVPFLILSPFVALAIKIESSGPVFYKQKRVGKNGKIFEFIKFRSMVKGADKIDGLKGNGDDQRHTKVGRFLRKTYIDELPQIINVLRGEMSFVGPRPERPHYVEELKKKIPFYEVRLLTRPGITGWAQISMKNDASVEDAPEKLQYDLYYIKNRSIVMDLGIMLKTTSTMASRSGR
ncbi:MAG TPA: sugar transferase [Candidatus Paceibacterota bacterium]